MATESALLCLPLPGDPPICEPAEMAATLSLVGVAATIPRPRDDTRSGDSLADTAVRQWLADAAMALRLANPPAPTLVVLQGAACQRAPDLAVALRGARRTCSGYVLIGGSEPQGPGWPDAPVMAVNPLDAAGSRRRGWEVLDGHPPAVVAELAARA